MDNCTLNEYERGQVQEWLWDRQDGGIRDVLNGLSYNSRRLIELRYGLADGHRYSVEETAEIFTKSVNWVKTIESYTLFQLYQFLVSTGKFSKAVRH